MDSASVPLGAQDQIENTAMAFSVKAIADGPASIHHLWMGTVDIRETEDRIFGSLKSSRSLIVANQALRSGWRWSSFTLVVVLAWAVFEYASQFAAVAIVAVALWRETVHSILIHNQWRISLGADMARLQRQIDEQEMRIYALQNHAHENSAFEIPSILHTNDPDNCTPPVDLD